MGLGKRSNGRAEHCSGLGGKYSTIRTNDCSHEIYHQGGVYQPSSALTSGGLYAFYDLCDELGILAWSEFLFSDALSPINPFLLESVEPEIRENVRRLNRHPSVAQWAGGNEIEGIVVQTNQTLPNGTIYLDQVRFCMAS